MEALLQSSFIFWISSPLFIFIACLSKVRVDLGDKTTKRETERLLPQVTYKDQPHHEVNLLGD